MKRILTLWMNLFILSLCSFLSHAQALVNQDWVTTGGLPNGIYDFQASHVIGSSGKIVVVGNTFHAGQNSNFLISEYTSDGNLIFKKEYDGTASMDDFTTDVTTIGSNIYVTGVEGDTSAMTSYITTLKLDSVGNILATWKYQNSYKKYNLGFRIVPDPSGSAVYVCGTSQTNITDFALTLLKYTTSGTQSWVSTYDSTGLYNAGVDMKVSGSSIIVYGISGLSTTSGDIITRAYATSNGALISQSRINNSGAYVTRPVAIAKDNNENLILVGISNDVGRKDDIVVVKLDSTLTLKWRKYFDGGFSQNDAVSSVKVDSKNNIILSGWAGNADTSKSIWTLRLRDSTVLWQKKRVCSFSGKDAKGFDMDLDASNNIYVTGKIYNGYNFDMINLSYDTSGNKRWEKQWALDSLSDDEGRNIKIDSGGYIYVYGRSKVGSSSYTYTTSKYEQWNPTSCAGGGRGIISGCPTITYTFKNSHTTAAGTDTFVEFDIYAKQYTRGLLYSGGNLVFTYADTIFGKNVVSNSNITITRGTITTNTNYNLTVKDTIITKSDAIPHNGGEVWLSIVPTVTTSGLYGIYDTLTQLCHVKMKMRKKSKGNCKIAFDQFFMQNKSSYYSGGNILYSYVYTNGRVGTLRADDINAQLTNISYTAAQGYLTFDLQVQSGDGDPFADADITLSYNTFTFGNPADFNCNQPASTSSDVNSGEYTLTPSSSSGSLEIQVAANSSSINFLTSASCPLPEIGSYTTVATCSLTVVNCCLPPSGPYINLTGVSGDYATFDENTSDSDQNNWYYYETGTSAYGTNGTASTSYNNSGSNICPSSSPSPTITSMDPLNIRAGTFDVLTILGSGFGCSSGQVLFPNADNGGASMMHTQTPDIVTWDDNKITLRVPSIQNATGFNPPGSGYIKVVTAGSDTSNVSPDALTIPYAVKNIRDGATLTAFPVALKNQNLVGGYTFRPAPYVTGDTLVAITKAMNDWVCQIGASIVMGTDTNITVRNSLDRVNSILFGLDSPNVLCSTYVNYSYPTSCSISSDTIGVIFDIDMVFNTSISGGITFDTSTNDSYIIPSGKVSLLGVSRHEFGHTLGLFHVLEHTLMYWTDPGSGFPAAQIQPHDAEGATFELTQVGPLDFVSGCYMVQSFVSPCHVIYNGISDVDHKPFNVSVYPNPFNENINLHFDLSEPSDVQVSIYDVLGQVVNTKDYGKRTGTFDEAANMSNLNSGIYIVRVSVGKQSIQVKMIKE